jgi:hypothetical protein
MRTAEGQVRTGQLPHRGALKVAGVLAAMVLVVGLALGGGQAVASSLPGEPSHAVKLVAERVRLELTTDPQARASLTLALAEERLDEVTDLARQGQSPDEQTRALTEQHLVSALGTTVELENSTAVEALQRLESAIQQRERTMAEALGGLPEPEQVQLRQVLQTMEQVRMAAHVGQGDPDGLRQRLRSGFPTAPPEQPVPSYTPRPSPSPRPGGAGPTDEPRAGSDVKPTPTCQPDRPWPTDPADQRPDHGPQPTDEPEPTEWSVPSPSPQPTERPAEPSPTKHPDPSSEPEEPNHAEPTQQPKPQPSGEPGGPGPRPPEEPGQPDPPGGSDPGPGPQPPGGDGGGGKGKP